MVTIEAYKPSGCLKLKLLHLPIKVCFLFILRKTNDSPNIPNSIIRLILFIKSKCVFLERKTEFYDHVTVLHRNKFPCNKTN